MITDYILRRTNKVCAEPEIHQHCPGFSMFNTGSVEVEIAEFLWSLVRMLKPENVLETGTHLGVSTLYMALALNQNKKGVIYTYEIISQLQDMAESLWADFPEARHHIRTVLESSLETTCYPQQVDFLFLDSEPGYRFDELLKFWPNLKVGGMVVIHDLDKTLGHHGQTYHNLYDWPYGYFKDKIGHLLDTKELVILNPLTPRGITIGQKIDNSFASRGE